VKSHKRISQVSANKERLLVQKYAVFPLTPALSPRERVGVRGKRVNTDRPFPNFK